MTPKLIVLMLVVGASTFAQYREPDPYYRNRGSYPDDRYSQPRTNEYGRNQQFLVSRVMSDLNRAAERARVDGHEAKHFNEVARNLQDFQARWAQGKFDSGKLDKAIRNLEHLVEANRVRGRDRDMLARDVNELRQFRASRGYDWNRNDYPAWR